MATIAGGIVGGYLLGLAVVLTSFTMNARDNEPVHTGQIPMYRNSRRRLANWILDGGAWQVVPLLPLLVYLAGLLRLLDALTPQTPGQSTERQST